MIDMEKKTLEKLIVQGLRGQYLEESGGEFWGEICADYRDEISGRVAGEIIDSDDPMQTFNENLWELYADLEWDYKHELIKEVTKSLRGDSENFPGGLNDEQEDFIDEFISERVWYRYPADHYLNQDMHVNIMVDTGDCNYDFTLNSAYPCWYGRVEDGLHDKAGIVWLAKTQGYSKGQLWRALKDDNVADPNGFLQSVRVELANLPSHMSTVTFLVKMKFLQLLELNRAIRWREQQRGRKYDPKEYPYCGYIILDKGTMCGLFDPWSGGGSVLEIQLENDVRLPIKYIWLAIPDAAKGHGYQVGDVYGMCGSAWQETLKEMHFPKKMKEVP